MASQMNSLTGGDSFLMPISSGVLNQMDDYALCRFADSKDFRKVIKLCTLPSVTARLYTTSTSWIMAWKLVRSNTSPSEHESWDQHILYAF
jgi:hypothetical protein